jgi:uncharacterized protein (TIGR02449 family)
MDQTDEEVARLAERVEHMLALVRRLAEENATLRGELAQSRTATEHLQQRIGEARARVEAALARLPVPAASAHAD